MGLIFFDLGLFRAEILFIIYVYNKYMHAAAYIIYIPSNVFTTWGRNKEMLTITSLSPNVRRGKKRIDRMEVIDTNYLYVYFIYFEREK